MENQKGIKLAFIIVLVIAVLSIVGVFYFYNKSLNVICNMPNCSSNKETIGEKNEDVIYNNNLEELKKIEPFKKYDELGILVYLEKYYLYYLPNKDISFTIKDLSDKDISMISWLYINNYTEGYNRTIEKNRVDNFISEYLNLQDYKIKNMKQEDNSGFGLEEKDNKYVISSPSGEWMLPVYRAKNISYDQKNQEIKVEFYKRANDLAYNIQKEGTAIFKINSTEPVAKISLLKVDYK